MDEQAKHLSVQFRRGVVVTKVKWLDVQHDFRYYRRIVADRHGNCSIASAMHVLFPTHPRSEM